MRFCFLLLPLVLLVTAAGDFANDRLANWPHWRGPLANGFAPNGNPPTRWDENSNVKWKVAIPGSGSATPIVWGDRLFVLTAIATDLGGAIGKSAVALALPAPTTPVKFMVLCLDRKTGKTIWQRAATEQIPHEGHHPTNTYASASPTTDGKHLFVSFGSRGIYCYDLEGNLKWKRDLGKMTTRNGFGEGASPAVHGDSLVINWDQETDAALICLDAKTGKDKWRVSRNEVTTWNTPLIVEHKGVTQVVVNATKRTRGYDLATGKLLWECGGQHVNPIPSVVTKDGIVYCMTGYQGFAVYAIPLDARGDVTDTDRIVWKRTDAGPYVASPLLYDDLLYFTKDRSGILSIVNAKTGEPFVNQERLPGLNIVYASIVGAAGKVYVTGREGQTVVLRHGPKLEVLATNRLDEGIDASPVIVGRTLYLRGEKHLYCIEEKS